MTLIGYRGGWFDDKTRASWRAPDWPRTVAASIWYPAADGSVCADIPIGPPDAPLFHLPSLAQDAEAAPGQFPVVLLSHDDGGSPLLLDCLAQALARQGFIVLGAHHAGNCLLDPVLPEGALAGWERARDLSFLLDIIASEGPLARSLDPTRVAAVGVGLGAQSALSLLGARIDADTWQAWAEAQIAGWPRTERFAVLEQGLEGLVGSDPVSQASWSRRTADYRDGRVTAACLLTPDTSLQGLSAASLQAIDRPVLILTDGSDPAATRYLRESMAEADWESLPDDGLAAADRVAGFLARIVSTR